MSALGIEEQRVNVILDFAEPLERVQTIGDGFRVNAKIVTFRAQNAVKVPVAALFRSGTQWAAFVVSDNRVRQQPVDVGRRNTAEAMVVGGLSPGDHVVVYPSPSLREHSRVVFARGE